MSSRPLPDAADYLQFAGGLADAAAAVTLPLFRQPLPIEVKSDSSPFTQADRDAEKAMVAMISARYPAHGVIGEEFGSKNTDAEFVWVLDPIDGTLSFISGCRQYATLVALLHHGMPVISVLDFPALSERWSGLYTESQCEARFNGAACRTAALVPPLDKAIAAITTLAVQPGAEDDTLQKFLPACGHVRLGGDAYAHASVATGFAHLALDYLMQPYDYLPLIPLVCAAGGVISDWQGAPLAPLSADGQKTVLTAANETLQRQALALLAAG